MRTDLFKNARNLYGLIHARFILTSRGVQLMVRACPRCRPPARLRGARPPATLPFRSSPLTLSQMPKFNARIFGR